MKRDGWEDRERQGWREMEGRIGRDRDGEAEEKELRGKRCEKKVLRVTVFAVYLSGLNNI